MQRRPITAESTKVDSIACWPNPIHSHADLKSRYVRCHQFIVKPHDAANDLRAKCLRGLGPEFEGETEGSLVFVCLFIPLLFPQPPCFRDLLSLFS